MGKRWADNEFDTAIPIQDRPEYGQAKIEILEFIKERVKETEFLYIGTVSRFLPAYREFLMDILTELRMEGIIDFDEHKPSPTRVTVRGTQKKPPSDLYSEVGWTNTPILDRGTGLATGFKVRSLPSA